MTIIFSVQKLPAFISNTEKKFLQFKQYLKFLLYLFFLFVYSLLNDSISKTDIPQLFLSLCMYMALNSKSEIPSSLRKDSHHSCTITTVFTVDKDSTKIYIHSINMSSQRCTFITKENFQSSPRLLKISLHRGLTSFLHWGFSLFFFYKNWGYSPSFT